MTKPFWFNLIQQWREKGMGEYGVSFPFLVGAVARENSIEINREIIENVFNEIINNPIKGHYCEVRWCGNLDEPVASIEITSSLKNKSIQADFKDEDNNVSLAFTTDLMSMFTLNCSTKEECLGKLITRTQENAEKGLFSKNNGVFGAFTESEVKFIKGVVSLSSNT